MKPRQNSTTSIFFELINDQEIKASLKRENILGSGSFSQVYKGIFEGKEVAIKERDNDAEGQREKEILKMLTSGGAVNTVKYFGECTFKGEAACQNQLYLITEFIHGITLYDFIINSANNEVSAVIKYRIMMGLLKGIKFIHDMGIIHGDLKPDNILLRQKSSQPYDFNPVICDFSSAIRQTDTPTNKGMASAISFAAPEVIRNKMVGPASDIYSFGRVMACMEQKGFYQLPVMFYLKDIHSGAMPTISPEWPTSKLILQTWKLDPEARPTMRNVTIQLHFFANRKKKSKSEVIKAEVPPRSNLPRIQKKASGLG